MAIVPKILIFLPFLLVGYVTLVEFFPQSPDRQPPPTIQTPTPLITKKPLPPSYIIQQKMYVVQTFNNCGPASLSMALSYFDINISQQLLGEKIRPWQNPEGINDDKSVLLSELANEAKNHGFTPFHRPNGSVQLLQSLIAEDIPVITRTFLNMNEDIGHYRVVRGYDDTTQEFLQDDSYTGENLRYSYDDFLRMWQPFSYEYLVIVPKDKEEIVKKILGDDINEKNAWQQINLRAADEQKNNPENIYAAFNSSRSYYHLGEYAKSVEVFEKIESLLPFRMLWYQTEPIQAYLKLGNYERVLQMTSTIINNNNLAYSELYVFRAEAYRQLGQIDQATEEINKALLYNKNSEFVINAKNAVEINQPIKIDS